LHISINPQGFCSHSIAFSFYSSKLKYLATNCIRVTVVQQTMIKTHLLKFSYQFKK